MRRILVWAAVSLLGQLLIASPAGPASDVPLALSVSEQEARLLFPEGSNHFFELKGPFSSTWRKEISLGVMQGLLTQLAQQLEKELDYPLPASDSSRAAKEALYLVMTSWLHSDSFPASLKRALIGEEPSRLHAVIPEKLLESGAVEELQKFLGLARQPLVELTPWTVTFDFHSEKAPLEVKVESEQETAEYLVDLKGELKAARLIQSAA